MKLGHLFSCLSVCLALGACAAEPGRDAAAMADDCGAITASNIDDCVRLNEIQVIGTHNSYHVAPAPAMLETLAERGRNLEYTHRPLKEQLSELGVRQFELDVFADPEGGHFAEPAAFRVVDGLDPLGAEWRRPGFKVLHVQDIDYRATCSILVACLTEIRDWSLANPWHVPIMILLEAKDGTPDDPSNIGFVEPVPIGSAELRALDDEIRSVFEDDHVITPDDVRGSHAALDEAIQSDGWPLLREARGKILLALDNTGRHREDYLNGHPSLEGRMLFVSSGPGTLSAGFIKMNDVLEEGDLIRERVGAGYLVRTRADIPTAEARSGDTTRRDAAFRSGAQYVSTDYPEESPFGSGYIARLPGGAGDLTARCNPVSAPAGCRDEWLEPDARR